MLKRIIELSCIIAIITTLFSGHLLPLGTNWLHNDEYTYKLDDDGTAILLQYNKTAADVISVPSQVDGYDVSKIEGHCYDCRLVSEIIIPIKSVTVCSEAFLNCDSIVILNITDDINADASGFKNMVNLQELNIIHSSGKMRDYPDENSSPWSASRNMLISLSIDDGIYYLGDYCFADTTALANVHFPDCLQTIGAYCFKNSSCLGVLDLTRSLVTLKDNCFSSYDDAEFEMILPDSIRYFGENCLPECGKYICFRDTEAERYVQEKQLEYQSYDPSFKDNLYSVKLAETLKIPTPVLPERIADDTAFDSSDELVATIDNEGNLAAVTTGYSNLTITSPYFQYSTTVNVYLPDSEYETRYLALKTGQSYQANKMDFHIPDDPVFALIYSSFNPSIASVDETGLIRAGKNGSTYIRLSDSEGNIKQYLVKVSNMITGITLNKSSVTLNIGETFQLKATVSPSNVENKKLKYVSSDTRIATVSETGKIKAINTGTATITITPTDGSEITKKVNVTVTKDTISVNVGALPMMIGKKFQLTASSQSGKQLVYNSKNSSIVSVDETGCLYAHSAGEVVITISTADGLCYRSINVKVYGNAVAYGIDVSQWQGTISLSSMQKIKDYGIDFIYIRAAYDVDYEDPRFQENYRNAKNVGLDVGAYHYIESTTTAGAIAEANWMLSIIRGKKFEYPIMLDIESSSHKALSSSEFCAIIDAYCRTIKAGGFEVIVYSYASLLNKAGALNGKYDFYIAHWDTTRSTVFRYPFTMWQFTSSGKLPVFRGRVDMDLSFFDYPSYFKKNHLNGF